MIIVFYIEQAEEQEVPEILEFMNKIYEKIPDKSWFSMDSRENLVRYMSTSGFALKAEMCDEGSDYELVRNFYSPDIRTWGGESRKIPEFK